MLLAVVPSLRVVVIFDQRLKGFCQQFSLFTKLLQQHRQQVSARNNSVSSAIESTLNSELSHFHPFFCKELPLNQGRTEIAHLQTDLLFDLPLVIAVEILELRDVVVEAGVKSGRENQGGGEVTASRSAQRHICSAKLGR